MALNWNILLLGLLLSTCSPTYGRIHFEKLSASEVYRVLREAGRLDAVPEGRVVTQGIAAATGFIAGITKGIAIPFLAGLVFPSTGNSTNGQTTVQEICFSSRSASEIDDTAQARSNNENNNEEPDTEKPEARQDNPTSPTSSPAPTTPTATPTTGTPPTTTGTNTETATPTTTSTGATSPTATTTGSSPTITFTSGSPTTTGAGTATTTDDGTGSGTDTSTTTDTGTGGSVNCIVIEKPVVG